MRKVAILAVLCGVALSGCAATRTGLSHADAKIMPADARALAEDAAWHLSGTLPAAKTTLVLYPTVTSKEDKITEAFSEALRSSGFGVLEAPRRRDEPMPTGIPLRYRVSALDAGLLMRLEYLNVAAARFYLRAADNSLVEAAPFTVRENSQ